MLASYATVPAEATSRKYPEKPTPYRSEFERDRDRIIHADAFKRLQYKTQVFVNHYLGVTRSNDHYRNRLTHSLEVATISRSIAKALGLSDDLAEAVALAHDLGHSPFGHAGEDALNSCMKNYGGFSHNDHSFKLLTFLEHKYAAYPGLNLTWEVIEGIAKHNGPIKKGDESPFMANYNAEHNLDLTNFSSAEAQVAAYADDIAYIGHDLEDSINTEIVSFNDLEEIEFIGIYIKDLKKQFPNIGRGCLIYEVVRKITHRLIESLIFCTRTNIKKYKIKTSFDVRNLGRPLVQFNSTTEDEIAEIKRFLSRKVYKHPNVLSINIQCQKVIKGLFDLYSENIELLPASWLKTLENSGDATASKTLVAEYLAGMTDRFAISQYQSFFNLTFNNLEL